MESNAEKGEIGESVAKAHLIRRGYEIIRTNYAVKTGEIDIIAKHGEYIVFVEVKYRKNYGSYYPREAVTKQKQSKIKKAALNYITKTGIVNTCFRFDVIEVTGMREFKVEHIENAFSY